MSRRSARGRLEAHTRMRMTCRRLAGAAAVALGTLGILAIPTASVYTPAAAADAAQPTYNDGLGIHPGLVKHVWLIILENKSYDASFTGLNNNTYLWQTLPSQGVLLKNYFATGHSSQDNYTSLVSGQAPQPDIQDDCQDYTADNGASSVNGVATDEGVDTSGEVTKGFASNTLYGSLNWPATYAANPNFGQWTSADGANAYLYTNGCVYPQDVPTLFNQFDAAGITWKGYAQDLGDPTTDAETASNSGTPWNETQAGGSGLTGLTLDQDACGAPYDSSTATTWPYASVGAAGATSPANPGSANTDSAYVPKHFPFPWFSSLLDNKSDCNPQHIGPAFDDPQPSEAAGANSADFYSDLQADENQPDAYPNFVWITPDNCSDAHDASCANTGAGAETLNGHSEGGNLSGDFQSDATTGPVSGQDIPNPPTTSGSGVNGTGGLYAADLFLKHVVPEIEASKEFQDGGLIDVTFDEGYPPETFSNSFYDDQNQFLAYGRSGATGSDGTTSTGATQTTTQQDGLGARIELNSDAAGETLRESSWQCSQQGGAYNTPSAGDCQVSIEPTGPNVPVITDPITGEVMSPGPGDGAGLDRPDNCKAQTSGNSVTISDYNSSTGTPGTCILGFQPEAASADTSVITARTDSVTGSASSSGIQDSSVRVTDQGRAVSGTNIPAGSYVGAVVGGPVATCTSYSNCTAAGLADPAPALGGSTGNQSYTAFFQLVNSAGGSVTPGGPVTSITLSADCDPTPVDEGGPATTAATYCSSSSNWDPYYDSNTGTYGGGQTGSVLISPYIRPGTVSNVYYNHYSWLRTMEDLFAVGGAGNPVAEGLDGEGHIGYAAQPGLVPFGRDVFTNAPARRGVDVQRCRSRASFLRLQGAGRPRGGCVDGSHHVDNSHAGRNSPDRRG